ncbi:uncharacterized protein BDR25DRAFT_344857 [Lindgomyces ingoldianus]|uniref:Uncharacterized protein n=1 Tax=Lindgomyces ingoldianus TaxID=673940 RepID=A0ACB6QKF5_9PLEO|nr:uncharacterized protein BDR25DRAFT_344857 [Lindgomyces ingoldianus]KAF2467473.1 hypothetical protein BDR25DRAFT_344857 [Lindgomyces ingoldianus]
MGTVKRQSGALNSVWEEKYSRQRAEGLYIAEDGREDRLAFPSGVSLFEYLERGDKDNFIETLLKYSKDRLEPPGKFRFSALRSYLSSADFADLNQGALSTRPTPSIIILDERRDPIDTSTTTRHWDSDAYLRYPPQGTNVSTEELDLCQLVQRLTENRRLNGAERRTLYVSHMTSSCAMAIIGTAPTRSIPILRKFLHNHLLSRTQFRISLSGTYTIEFHIPYFALREGPPSLDNRRKGEDDFQAHKLLPLPRPGDEEAYYYEAQTSFLLTGIDERLYSVICFVDTFFESEQSRDSYLDTTSPLDAPSGGSLWLQYPVWNPRQYALAVQSHRIFQAREEWTALINCFVERLKYYERLYKLPDDPMLTRTSELTEAESTIRLFRDQLISTIRAWDEYYDSYGSLYEVESVILYNWWQKYLGSIRESVSELRVLHELMAQKLELFKSMRDGLVNASAFKESAEATRQGNKISILTRITMLFLPFTSVTAFFSLPQLPQSAWLWFAYWPAVFLFLVGTVYISREPELLQSVFGEGYSRQKPCQF